MAVNTTQALALVKARLNRISTDTSLDEYLTARIGAAAEKLNRMMPRPLDDSTADLMLLVDLTCWDYANRDKPDAQPQWLRMRLRERFLDNGGAAL